MANYLFINARLATQTGRGLIAPGALRARGGKIDWLGPMQNCQPRGDEQVIDCGGHLITPGLIDCHTHLVYGGDRSGEFELRLQGVSYADIARQGGGIQSTVRATRSASELELLAQARPRLQNLLNEGVTTLEIKSGYGLDRDNEIKMLRVARQLGEICDVQIKTTFLGAHALPPEYTDDPNAYIELVCADLLPTAYAEGLVDAVDVFIEDVAFDAAQARRVFETASALGLPVKAHSEQFSDMGGAALACEFNALSLDHIEYLTPETVGLLAKSNTVAVLLPGAFYTLHETQPPPIDALRKHGVPMAVATDANPGSSPLFSVLLCMNMACTLFGLTPEEALQGVTINAAKALGLEDDIGSLSPGKRADLALWDVENPAMLSYQIGLNPCIGVMREGRWSRPFLRESTNAQ